MFDVGDATEEALWGVKTEHTFHSWKCNYPGSSLRVIDLVFRTGSKRYNTFHLSIADSDIIIHCARDTHFSTLNYFVCSRARQPFYFSMLNHYRVEETDTNSAAASCRRQPRRAGIRMRIDNPICPRCTLRLFYGVIDTINKIGTDATQLC